MDLWPDALTVVDPVMGDHGRMYRGLAPEMVPAMYTLCSRASLILPNTTEAALLLGDPMPGVTGEAELHTAQAQAQRLTRICPRVLITGVAAGRGIACVGADRATGESLVRTPMVPKSFHGTGDIFGAVLVGLSFAKSLAFALGVPLIPVHHIRGHIAANYLAFPELEPPFLALAISGGNTLIVDVRDYTDMKILGATRDDAAGECFDKAARVLGLPYPGGAPMDKLAQKSKGGVYTLPVAHVEGAPLDMSFSGLKTAVVNLAHHAEQVGQPLDAPALARDFAQAVSDTLVPRAMEAAQQAGRTVIAAAGGVAANSVIRGDLERACAQAGYHLYLPPLRWCGDNGAMIGAQGYYEYLAGHTAGMELNAYATRDINA